MSGSASQRVWIIGGSGFLGSALAQSYRLSGARTLSIDPAGPVDVQAPVQNAIPQALSHFAPQLVCLCAATHGGDAAAYRRTYVEPVRCLAAALPGVRLLLCSSTAVYEGGGDVEESAPTPGSSEKKRVLLEAEEMALAAGGIVARLAALYGPGRCELLRRHLEGAPRLPGPPQRMLNYVHVDDAVSALQLLGGIAPPPHRVYNVCGESLTHAEAYDMLAAVTGLPAVQEMATAGRRGRADHRVLSARLRSLGWCPRMSLREFAGSYHS